MKLLICLCCTITFGFSPVKNYSQNAEIKIVEDKTVSVEQIFGLIRDQTNYNFVFRSSWLANLPEVELQKGSIRAGALLDKSLAGKFNYEYRSEVETILIVPRVSERGEVKKPPQAPVYGNVTDVSGTPLMGVTVFVKRTLTGVVTNLNGHYQIDASVGDTLVYRHVSFVDEELVVEALGEINVVMEMKEDVLEEVVIESGYETISRERATGSYSKITEEDFESQRPADLSAILEGRIAGVQDGVIRGVTSMNGLTTPLYVVDGFPVEQTRYDYETFNLEENLPNINIEDIESITVLKDAAATSIYGARAANGVVVITTKKAKAGETNISFSSYFTLSPYNYYTGNLTNSAEILGLEQEWASGNPNLQATDGSAAAYASSLLDNAVFTSQGMQTLLNYYAGNISESERNTILDRLGASGYQYYDDLERYAKRDQYHQQYNISFGKATENNSFNASLTYKDNKFEDLYSEENSVGLNLKNSTEFTDWLSVDLGTYMLFSKENEQSYHALNPGFVFQPYDRLLNEDGTSFTSTAESRYDIFTLQSLNDYSMYNMDITPMEELGSNLRKRRDFLNRTFAKINLKFSDAFSYNVMFQYNYGVGRLNQLRDKNSFAVRNQVNSLATISPTNQAVYNLPYGNISYRSDQVSNSYNFRQQLNFEELFNELHFLKVIAGTEMRHSKLEYNDYTRYGYDPQTLSFTPVNQADLLQVYGSVLGGYMSQNQFSAERELVNRYISAYANAGYTFDTKYTVTGSLRWDRSNLWGTDNKYQNKPTWSAGASWNIDNEAFFDPSWADRLKLRASHGIGGNIAKNSAPYLTAYYSANNNVGGIQGSVSSRPNPELSWEKTTTTNLGLDFSVLSHRLRGTIDLYHKKGEDLLASSNGVPTEGWGYSTYTINNGEMINRGIELSLDGTVLQTSNFSWNLGVLYAHNKNEVTYVDVEAPVYFLQLDYPSEFPRVGTDFNSIYGYKWAGLSNTGLPQVYDAEGNAVSHNPADLEAIEEYGTTVPVQSGSFRTSLSYKNFSLSALFLYELGHKVRNDFLPMFTNNYSSALRSYIPDIRTVNRRIVDRWTNPGDEAHTNVPRAVFEYDPDYSYDLQSIYSYADLNILDASNLRLSNVSLAYEISPDLASRWNIENIRINFNVENVFTLAKSRDVKYLLGGYQTPNYVLGLNLNL